MSLISPCFCEKMCCVLIETSTYVRIFRRLATEWTVWGSNPGGGRDFPNLSRPALGPTQSPVQWIPGFSRGVKSGRSVTLTPHPLLMPWLRKSRAISLLPLWAVRPVQSLSACTRVHFTFLCTYILFQKDSAAYYSDTSANE